MKELKERISKKDVAKLTTIGSAMDTKVFVAGSRGIFRSFPPMLDFSFIDYDITTSLSQGRYHGKLEIKIRDEKMLKSSLCERLKGIHIPSFDMPGEAKLLLIKYRALVIAGLALTGVAESTHVAGFNESAGEGNNVFDFTHEMIHESLKKKMVLTGNINADFKEAAKILWFHFPIDITGFDNAIKRISLEKIGSE